jgi:hypothetical protein
MATAPKLWLYGYGFTAADTAMAQRLRLHSCIYGYGPAATALQLHIRLWPSGYGSTAAYTSMAQRLRLHSCIYVYGPAATAPQLQIRLWPSGYGSTAADTAHVCYETCRFKQHQLVRTSNLVVKTVESRFAAFNNFASSNSHG